MKRFVMMLVLATVIVSMSVPAQASPAAGAKPAVVRGELVDMGCYLGHEAKGEKHRGCATKCIAGGMPMGLLTADGTLYLLTLSHDIADPYNQAKQLAGSMVEVTGPVLTRGGVKALQVDAIKAVK